MFPSPKEIKDTYSLPEKEKCFIEQSRQTSKNIFLQNDTRYLIILGPCSITDRKTTLHYAYNLRKLQKKISSKIFCIMRVFVEKPRSSLGWKGFISDPDMNGQYDIQKGIIETRKLLIELAILGIPVCTEFLDPSLALYTEDLITWGIIGARTSTSQIHRQFSSLLPFPIGIKNSIDGNVDAAIHAVLTANTSHAFPLINEEGKLSIKQSFGNPFSHVILRGAHNHTNYDKKSIEKVKKNLLSHRVTSRLIIDCSHGNCTKNQPSQKECFYSCLEQIKQKNHSIMGIMLESNINSGTQKISKDKRHLHYGVSVTDPCINWETTKKWLLEAFDTLS